MGRRISIIPPSQSCGRWASFSAYISETATSLKISLEKNLIENGWPQFDNSNIVLEKEIISPDLLIVSKILNQTTGRTVIDKLFVKKQMDDTYKVAGLLSE